MNFQEYRRQNGAMALKIKLRRNQLKLSEKSAAMAIWLGKQYLGQRENGDIDGENKNAQVLEIIKRLDGECDV